MSVSACSDAGVLLGPAISGTGGEPRPAASPLRILHCLRAPVGGLFRHVRDLAAGQAAAGHLVGIVCDSNARDGLTELRLAALAGHARLGIVRVPMAREIGPSDLMAAGRVRDAALALRADILHGHGAKGGAFARVAAGRLRSAGRSVLAFYTPHGGSLHYAPRSLKGRIYHAVERGLLAATDGLVFESAFAARVFADRIGLANAASRIVPNGLLPHELEPVAPAVAAADVVFVGELRRLKGVDVLIEALARLAAERPSRRPTAVIVGEGPDGAQFRDLAATRGLADVIAFPGAMPARDAFALGRVLIVPSRTESFPYVVLEGAAAGLPVIASDVGGIPEMVAGTDTALLPPGDVAALAGAIRAALEDPDTARARADRLRAAVAARFTAAVMTAGVLDFYAERRSAGSQSGRGTAAAG